MPPIGRKARGRGRGRGNWRSNKNNNGKTTEADESSSVALAVADSQSSQEVEGEKSHSQEEREPAVGQGGRELCEEVPPMVGRMGRGRGKRRSNNNGKTTEAEESSLPMVVEVTQSSKEVEGVKSQSRELSETSDENGPSGSSEGIMASTSTTWQHPQFKIGDLVWAKMKGFCPWPAQICQPDESVKQPKTKKDSVFVNFFGSSDFSWIESKYVRPYEELKEVMSKMHTNYTSKRPAFGLACEIIESKARNIDLETKNDQKEETMSVKDLEIFGGAETASQNAEADEDRPATSSAKAPKRKSKASRVSGIRNKKPRPNKNGNVELGLQDNKAELAEALNNNMANRPLLRFGILGLGPLSSGIVSRLREAGLPVIVWDTSREKMVEFREQGVETSNSPAEVVEAADITFSCLKNPEVAKDVFYANNGVLQAMNIRKGFVEMTTVDPEHSGDIADAVKSKGGLYLEAQIQGNPADAQNGNLSMITAGAESLFDLCQVPFKCMAKNCVHVGETGNASKYGLALHLIADVSAAATLEAFSLVQKSGIDQGLFMEILKRSDISTLHIVDSARSGIDFDSVQKRLQLALKIGNTFEEPTPVTAAANEYIKMVMKAAKNTEAIYNFE